MEKILVCLKQVPNTNEIKIDPENHTLIRGGVDSILNPYYDYSLEKALALKRKSGIKPAVYDGLKYIKSGNKG